MAQLNLYLDDDLARRLDEITKTENVSRSRWVRSLISQRLSAGGEESYPLLAQDPFSSEVRQPESALGRVDPTSSALKLVELESLRQGRPLDDVLADAVQHYFESLGRPLEEDPVAAAWGSLHMAPATMQKVLSEVDSLWEK